MQKYINIKLTKAILSFYKTIRNYVRADNMETQNIFVKESLEQEGY